MDLLCFLTFTIVLFLLPSSMFASESHSLFFLLYALHMGDLVGDEDVDGQVGVGPLVPRQHVQHVELVWYRAFLAQWQQLEEANTFGRIDNSHEVYPLFLAQRLNHVHLKGLELRFHLYFWLDDVCGPPTMQSSRRLSLQSLHDLLAHGQPIAQRVLPIHNLFFFFLFCITTADAFLVDGFGLEDQKFTEELREGVPSHIVLGEQFLDEDVLAHGEVAAGREDGLGHGLGRLSQSFKFGAGLVTFLAERS